MDRNPTHDLSAASKMWEGPVQEDAPLVYKHSSAPQ
jgi:hypothetical protein